MDMSSTRITYILLSLIIAFMRKRCITVTAWNCRGLGPARPYLAHLMKNCDVMCISEHQLYECELNRLTELDPDFTGYGRSSLSLKPENYGKAPVHCGVGILWRKTLSPCIRPLRHLGTDRFCAIEVAIDGQRPLYIASLYMPHQGCQISDYDTHIDCLEACISQWQGDVILIGDWNVHLGKEFGPRDGVRPVKTQRLLHLY